MTATANLPAAPLARPRRSVAWLGSPPEWLGDAARPAASPTELASLDPAAVHVSSAWASQIPAIRRAVGSARIVLDLCDDGDVGLRSRAAAGAAAADVILLPTISALERFRAAHVNIAGSSTLFRAPLDMERWAPEETLVATRSRDVKRLRRLHRLAGPIVLYVGPYTPAGGLAQAIAAVSDLHTRHTDLRLVTIPEGRIDRRHLDRCERAALGLGHHGIVEWVAEPDDLPLWYALAAVVIAPDAESDAAPRAWRAAAAGRPYVGAVGPATRDAVEAGETGVLLPAPVDARSLVAAVDDLLVHPERADELGAAARRRAEAERSYATALRRLHRIWGDER